MTHDTSDWVLVGLAGSGLIGAFVTIVWATCPWLHKDDGNDE